MVRLWHCSELWVPHPWRCSSHGWPPSSLSWGALSPQQGWDQTVFTAPSNPTIQRCHNLVMVWAGWADAQTQDAAPSCYHAHKTETQTPITHRIAPYRHPQPFIVHCHEGSRTDRHNPTAGRAPHNTAPTDGALRWVLFAKWKGRLVFAFFSLLDFGFYN